MRWPQIRNTEISNYRTSVSWCFGASVLRQSRPSVFCRRRRLTLLLLCTGALILPFTACPSRQSAGPETGRLDLWFVDSLALPAQTGTFCADPAGLLMPENSGTNIMAADFELHPQPAIPIPQRVTGILGIAADAFSIYLFDAGQLYRLDRSNGSQSTLSSNIRYEGAAMLASGELLFSDGYSDRILTFDPSGTVSDVNARRPEFKPSALASGPDNRIFVINQGDQELAVFDRIGNFLRACPLPGPANRVAVDDSANAYLLDRTGTQVWQITRRNQVRKVTAEELGIRFVAFDIAVHHNWLYLLDQGRRVLRFRLALD
jgi:hypothetical protein